MHRPLGALTLGASSEGQGSNEHKGEGGAGHFDGLCGSLRGRKAKMKLEDDNEWSGGLQANV
jgi:hypothetical protein